LDFKFGSLLCLLLAILHHLLFFNNLIKTNKTIFLIKHNRKEFGVGKSEAAPLGFNPKRERARWDLNPRFPAPKADALIRARLRALLHREQ
jgi:hypothetical protein